MKGNSVQQEKDTWARVVVLPRRQSLLAISDLTNLMQVLPWETKSGSAETSMGRQSPVRSKSSLEGTPSLQHTRGIVSPFSSTSEEEATLV